MISDKNTYVQIIVSKKVLELIKTICESEGVSVSSFCGQIIMNEVIERFIKED